MNGQHTRAEVGFRPKPSDLPISKGAIRRCLGLWRLGREDSHQDIGAFREISCAGDHNCRSNFRLYRALEEPNDDVSGLQPLFSDSVSSRRRTDAARNSSGGSRPNAVSMEASWEFKRISIILDLAS